MVFSGSVPSSGIAGEDVVYVCNGILLHHKKNEIRSFVEMQLDLETVTQSEVSHKKNIVY